MGFYTGLRLGDIAGLTWESVDMEQGFLRMLTQKTEARVAVPIHPRLAVWLKSRAIGIGKAPVFPDLAGKPSGGAGGLSAQFSKLLVRAKIDRVVKEREGEAGHKRSGVSFHSLRHSFVTNLANAGVPADIRKELVGHATGAVHEIYTHLDPAVLADAISKLPKLTASSAGS